jgi:hypothetical protein
MTSTETTTDVIKFLMHSQCEKFYFEDLGGKLYINVFISFVENVDQMHPQKIPSFHFIPDIYKGFNSEKNKIKFLLMSGRNRDNSLPTTFSLSMRSKVFHPSSNVCYSSQEN